MTREAEARSATAERPGSAAAPERPRSAAAAAVEKRAPARWHPAFVHFPIACWVLATLLDAAALAGFDAAAAARDLPDLTAMSSVLLWVGLAFSVPAIGIGLLDYATLPSRVRDSAEMLRHVAWMGGAASLFLSAALLRAGADQLEAAYFTALEALGTICLVIGGHYAAVVVFEHLPRAAADPLSPPPPPPSPSPGRRRPSA